VATEVLRDNVYSPPWTQFRYWGPDWCFLLCALKLLSFLVLWSYRKCEREVITNIYWAASLCSGNIHHLYLRGAWFNLWLGYVPSLLMFLMAFLSFSMGKCWDSTISGHDYFLQIALQSINYQLCCHHCYIVRDIKRTVKYTPQMDLTIFMGSVSCFLKFWFDMLPVSHNKHS
jgi:hypothetical protein